MAGVRMPKVALALAFLIGTNALAAPVASTVGKVDATFQVDSSGAAVYEVALKVPPGTANVEPQLSLFYNSQRGNGILGVGWSLSGLAAVNRCLATLAQDGFPGSINYDANDRFCLDGQRLVAYGNVGGTVFTTDAQRRAAYGLDSTVYRTEDESWARVVSSGACGSGPCYFTVQQRSGLTLQLGQTSDSRVLAVGKGGSVRSWMVNRISDRSSSYLTVAYVADPLGDGSSIGAVYPGRVDYTANDTTTPPLASRRAIAFSYEARPDSVELFESGSQVRIGARLSQIQTSVDQGAVKQYQLQYRQPAPRSFPQQLFECDGQGACLPPTVFAWGQDIALQSLSYVPSTLAAKPGRDSTTLMQGDFNGDGLVDVVMQSGPTAQQCAPSETGVYLSTGGGVAPVICLGIIANQNSTTLQLADINGDGRVDILVQGGGAGAPCPRGQTAFYASAGNGVQPLQCLSIAADRNTSAISIVDFNGDNLDDVVVQSGASDPVCAGKLAVYVSSGAGVLPARCVALATNRNTDTMVNGDYNGDGRADFVVQSSASVQPCSVRQVALYISTGSDLEAVRCVNVFAPRGLSTVVAADFNGDGLTDLVVLNEPSGGPCGGQVAAYVSTGTDFNPPLCLGVRIDLRTVTAFASDVNGDGLADVVVQQGFQATVCPAGQPAVFLSTGVAFAPVQCLVLDANKDARTLLLADVDGDGRADMVVQTTAATATCPAGSTCLYRQDPASPPAGVTARHSALLSVVTNGLGGVLQFTYKPLSDRSVYAKGALPTYPSQAVQNSLMVVAASTKTDGRTQSYSIDYRYSGAQRDLLGRGWQGYAQAVATDRETKLANTRFMNQVFPYAGRPDHSFSSCDAGNPVDPRCTQNATLLSSMQVGTGPQGYVCLDSTTNAACTASTRIYFVAKALEQQTQFDYGRPLFSTLKKFAYDGYGNVTLESDLGNPQVPDDKFYNCTAYQIDLDAWQVGLETKRVVAADPGCETVLRQTSFAYTTDGRFNVAAKTLLDDSVSPARSITSSYGYDGFGNLASVSLPTGTQTTDFDPDYRTFPITNRWPANAQGVVISETMASDPRFGVTVAYFDPNGNQRLTCLDGFGRTVAEQVQAGSDVPPDPPCPAKVASGPVATLRQQTFGQDSRGAFTEIRERAQWSVADPAQWSWSREYYDGLDRVFHRGFAGLDATWPVAVDIVFDSQGLTASETLPYVVGDPTTPSIVYTYDILGRVVRRVDARQVVTTFAYSGSATETFMDTFVAPGSVGQGRTTKRYDARSALARIDFYRDDGSYFSTVFGRDRLRRLLSAATGNIGISQAWDSLDRIVQRTAPDKGVTRYFYDTVGLLEQQVEANAQSTTFVHDALRRPVQVTGTDGTSIVYTYDAPTATNSRGRLSRVQVRNASGIASEYGYGYDVRGNVSARTALIDGESFATTQAYDPRGSLATLRFPDGTTRQTDYYVNGRLRAQSLLGTIAGDFPDLVVFQDYTGAGNLKKATYGGGAGASATFTYDTNTTQLSRQLVKGAGASLLDDAYQWDDQGRVRAIVDSVKAGGIDRSRAFAYSSLSRLTSATGPYGNKSFEFADDGSVLLKDGIAYTNVADQVSTGSAGGAQVFSAGFDANGNLAKEQAPGAAWVFSFDSSANLLEAVDANGNATRFAYDHMGRRVLRADAQKVTTYYPLQSLRVSVLPTGERSATYYLPGVVDQAVAVTTTTSGAAAFKKFGRAVPPLGVSFLHQDYLGSTSLLTDANGSPQARLVYQPFGDLDPASSVGQGDVELRFASYVWDPSTQLYYDNSRYYDPQRGRFLSPDPDLGREPDYASSYNRYAYVNDNPTNLIDPDGRWEIPILSQVIDAGFIAYDLYKVITQPSAANVAFLAIDVLSAVAPGLPDGSGEGMRIGRMAADDAAVAERSIQDAARVGASAGRLEARGAAKEARAARKEEDAAHDACFSFSAGTLVATAHGARSIETLRSGDYVLSHDLDEGGDAYNRVHGTRVRAVSRLLVIYAGGASIETTPEHPFFADGGGGWEWIAAADLRPGDRLKTAGAPTEVERLAVVERETLVYNFEVDRASTYYVSNAHILVHNPPKKCTRASGRLQERKVEESKEMESEKRVSKPTKLFGKGDGIMEPGPYGHASIPAEDSRQTFSTSIKDQVNSLGNKYGCHRCGTKISGYPDGHFTPDHQPPTATNFKGEKQKLYPHCKACSSKQGGMVAAFLKLLGY